jgi:sirohydrochlorin ferrochelatase
MTAILPALLAPAMNSARDKTPPGTAPDFAVIIVDHGSRLRDSNDQLLAVVDQHRRRWPGRIVEPAHMELAEPSIAQAFARCAEQGARQVVVFPYFLAPGRHWTEDIPRLAAQAAAPFPGVCHMVAPPFGLHSRLLDVIDARIAETLGAERSLPR